jgi:hypothetical protein
MRAAAGVAVVAAIGAPAAMAQSSVYYGALTASESTEARAWGVAYWARVEGGGPSTMTFSNAAMNSHLFNPFHGSRATLESLNLIGVDDCDKAIAESEVALMDSATLAKRSALKNAMCTGAFATNASTNAAGAEAHAALILSATTAANVTTYTVNGSLVSEGLPLEPVETLNAAPEIAVNVSTATSAAINEVVSAAPNLAQKLDGCTEAQKCLTGGESKADQMASHLRGIVSGMVSGTARVEKHEIAFGVYGSLPVCVVGFDDAYIVVDAITGAAVGPFGPLEPLAPTGLLALHAEYTGSGIRAFAAAGCVVVAGPGWHDNPPTGTTPWVPTPPTPGATPGSPGSAPGHWQNWQCTATAGGKCRCTSTGDFDDSSTPPKTNRVQVVCTCSQSAAGDCATPSPARPSTPATTPPSTPAVPTVTPLTGCSCIYQYYY